MQFDKTTSRRTDLVNVKCDPLYPIDPKQIGGFETWINWYEYWEGAHPGFDFATYLRTAKESVSECVIGLTEAVEVRAITRGRVIAVLTEVCPNMDPYYNEVETEHPKIAEDIHAHYGHVVSRVAIGDQVEEGDVIGTLAGSPRREDVLRHLHFALSKNVRGKIEWVDPAKLFTELRKIPFCSPQGNVNFEIEGHGGIRQIIANSCGRVFANGTQKEM